MKNLIALKKFLNSKKFKKDFTKKVTAARKLIRQLDMKRRPPKNWPFKDS